MSNEQKINDVIDEKAFKQLDQLYEALKRSADEYARMGAEILKTNNDISSSKSMIEVQKALKIQIANEENLSKAKNKALQDDEKLIQSRLKTAEMLDKQAKRDAANLAKSEAAAKKLADSQAKEEKALKSKQEAIERMAASEKSNADSVYNANIKVVVSEKAKQKQLENSEASARSAQVSNQKRIEQEAELAQKQSISFKGMLKLSADSDDALSAYGLQIDKLIQRQVSLRSSLSALTSSFKDLGDEYTVEQERDYILAQQQLKMALSQNAIETKRLVKEQSSASGSQERMEARLASLRAEYKKLTPEQKRTEDSAKALAKQIAQLDVAVKNGNEEMGVFNDSVGNYAKGMKAMEDHLDTINPALGGFVGQLKSAYAAAMAFIATPIGAAIAAIAAVLGGFKAWYDYNKGLEEATRLTRQFTDLQGDDLILMRSQVEALADVYGKDFQDVLVAVNATAKNFGLSYQESLDLVKDGFISGADASGDFLNQLKEYPTQLEAVGLSADETIALISQNVKSGIFSDKGIDTIKEGGLRIREMTKATSDALNGIGLNSKQIESDLLNNKTTIIEVIKQVSAQLSELPPQSAAVGTAIADIFGGPGEDAGLRYITTLKDIDLNLQGIVESQGELGEAQKLQIEATENLKLVTAALFDQTGGGFELMIANVKLLGTDLLLKLVTGFADAYNWVVRLYNGSLLFRGVLQTIKLTFQQVATVTSAMFQYLFENFKTLGSIIGAVLTGEFGKIGDILAEGGQKNRAIFREAGTAWATDAANAYENTLNGKLSEIDLTLNAGGDLNSAQGGGMVGGSRKPPEKVDKEAEKAAKAAQKEADKAAKIAEKQKQELEKTLLELTVSRLKAEQDAIKRQADSAKDIASDDKNGYEDRLFNLQYYLNKTEELIKADADTKKKENAKYLLEASAMERAGRLKDAEALKEIALIKNREIDEAVITQRTAMAKEGNKILESIYLDNGETILTNTTRQLESDAQSRMQILAEQYAKGKINDREYAEAREKTSNALAKELISNEISVTEQAMELAKLRGIDVTDQEKKLADLKIRLSKETANQQISDLEKVADREKQLNALKKELASELASMTFDLLNNAIDRDIDKLDKDIENINTKAEEEKAAIESSTLSEEEKQARLFALEQKKQVQTEQLEEKKAQLKLKQAKLERAQNILSIIGNTAAGIMKAFAELGPIAGIPFAAIIGAMGAAQLVSVVSQPLPQYYKGTDSSKDGFAHVGERGTELMIEPNGRMLLTPDHDTITHVKGGTKILTHEQTKRALASKTLRGVDNRPSVNRHFESNLSKLVDDNKKHNSRVAATLGKKQYFGTVVTKQGFISQVFSSNKLNNWKKKNGI